MPCKWQKVLDLLHYKHLDVYFLDDWKGLDWGESLAYNPIENQWNSETVIALIITNFT